MSVEIPSHLQEALDRYVEHGIPTGSFLQAVLENNLMEAVGRADETSLANLVDICRYIYNNIPSACHGSPDKVQKWQDARRKERKEYAR